MTTTPNRPFRLADRPPPQPEPLLTMGVVERWTGEATAKARWLDLTTAAITGWRRLGCTCEPLRFGVPPGMADDEVVLLVALHVPACPVADHPDNGMYPADHQEDR